MCLSFWVGMVVWKSKLSVLELHAVEILEIYEDVELDDSVEVFGPLIELDLGEGSSIHDVGEPPVKYQNGSYRGGRGGGGVLCGSVSGQRLC